MSGESNSVLNNVAHQLVAKFYSPPDRILSQGDIISLEALKDHFQTSMGFNLADQLYPYFFANYSYAIVLNADCDIVQEENRKPKVKCVQLAAVVEASPHIKKLLQKVSNKDHYFTRIIDEKTFRDVVRQFEKLINNQEKLYFYLPQNLNIGFNSAYLVRLDTSVSIQLTDDDEQRAQSKYQAFIKSRKVTLIEPYKSKLGESFASLFDRTGLTDAKDLLQEKYDAWVKSEMLKYFVAVDDDIYRRACTEIKALATEVGTESPAYADRLPALLEKHKSPSGEFQNLPIFEAIKKIVEARTKATVAPEILKNILSDEAVTAAFKKLQMVESNADFEND